MIPKAPQSQDIIPPLPTNGYPSTSVHTPQRLKTPSRTIFTPTNDPQKDLVEIRRTIERVQKEYAENFPEKENASPFSIQSTMRSSTPPEMLPLNLTILTVYDEQESSSSQLTQNMERPMSRSLILIDNTKPSSTAIVPFLDVGPPGQIPPPSNKLQTLHRFFPLIKRKRENLEEVVEVAKKGKLDVRIMDEEAMEQ